MKPRTTRRRARSLAGLPVSHLLAALSAAQWGALARRENHGARATLTALGRMLERYKRDRLGTLEATVGQVADWSGYSTRWVAHCLAVLEAMGVLTWHRGGVVAGRPTPSVFVVSRRALADLVEDARPGARAALRERAERTNERLRGLRSPYVKSKPRHNPRSDHVEVSADLSPSGEVSTGHTPPMTAVDGTLFGRWADIGTSGGGAARDDGPDVVGAAARADIRATLARARAAAR